MQSLTDLMKALQTRHAAFFNRRWDSLSAEDAKQFTQLERDMMAVAAALGRDRAEAAPDLQASIERLQARLESAFPEQRS